MIYVKKKGGDKSKKVCSRCGEKKKIVMVNLKGLNRPDSMFCLECAKAVIISQRKEKEKCEEKI